MKEGDHVRIRRDGYLTAWGTRMADIYPDVFELSGVLVRADSPGLAFVQFDGDIIGRTIVSAHLERLEDAS